MNIALSQEGVLHLKLSSSLWEDSSDVEKLYKSLMLFNKDGRMLS